MISVLKMYSYTSEIDHISFQGCMPLLLILVITYSLALFQKFQVQRCSRSECRSILDLISRKVAVRKNRSKHISPPCEQIIRQAEAANRQNRHGNLGFLSFEAAFSPQQMPLRALPQSHASWDQIAAQLPALIKTQTVRKTVDQMPLLSAGEHCLDDRYLLRAASLLGILAHAYVRLEGETSLTKKYKSHSDILPASLHIPWSQVCKRLGRTNTLLTYTDLVLHNFTTSADKVEDMTLENSRLLIPTVNNHEEQTFYGTMIETNAKIAPVMREIIEAQRSVLAEDRDHLKKSINRLIILIRGIMKVTLAKINTNPSKSTCMDPVVWTKTVANLAIPWLDGVIGPAGTAHPFFHMMDEFTDRSRYNTRIGAEALRIRADYPIHWQQFLAAVSQVSVATYVAQAHDTKLQQQWQSLNNVYSGDEGLLGFHRRKVYGFLSVSFRIGRDSTINGLGQRHGCQKWQEADDELEIARRERHGTKSSTSLVANTTHLDIVSTAFSIHELIQHNNIQKGFWFSARGQVYDATPFLFSHPGGQRTIALVSGQDATSDLAAVAHFSDPKTQAILGRYRIGSLRRRRFTSLALQDLYNTAAHLGFQLAEAENIYAATVQFLECRLTSADLLGDLDALRIHHFTESSMRLRNTQKPGLVLWLQDVLRCLSPPNTRNPGCSHENIECKAQTDRESTRDTRTTMNLSRESMRAIIERNCQDLAAIKMMSVQILERIESVPSDMSLTEVFCQSITCDIHEAFRIVNRLGQ